MTFSVAAAGRATAIRQDQLANLWNGSGVARWPGAVALLHLEIELAHQRAPLGLFAVDVLGVLLGRRGERVAALGQDALLDLFGLRQRAQGRVEPVDDRPRRAHGSQ